jgi:hypothetical protein
MPGRVFLSFRAFQGGMESADRSGSLTLCDKLARYSKARCSRTFLNIVLTLACYVGDYEKRLFCRNMPLGILLSEIS